MPTADGKYLLNDFDQELVDAGFDSIPQVRRLRWINFAYNRIASEFPWLWEQAIIPFTINPGEYYAEIVGATPDISRFRTIDHLYVTTDGHRSKLKRLDDDDAFFEDWLSQDLTSVAIRAEPTWYRIYSQRLYILPPPASVRTFDAHVHQRISQLTTTSPGTSDNPLTPQYLDQAIMLAAYAEAHKRVYEIQLAAQSEADLGSWLDQMRVDEEWQEPEMQERVEPDNTWR